MNPQSQPNSLEGRVIALIAEQLHIKPEEVTIASTLETLGADSLDRVELVMKFEEAFGVEIQDEEAEKLKTVSDLIAYIQRLKK